MNRSDEKGGGKKTVPSGRSQWRFPSGKVLLWILALLAVNYFLGKYFFPDPQSPVKIPYTVFKEQVVKGNVTEIFSRGMTVTGTFRQVVTVRDDELKPDADDRRGKGRPQPVKNFSTELPAFIDSGLETLLISKGVIIRAEPISETVSPFIGFLIRFGPALIIIALWIWIGRVARKGGLAGDGGFMGFSRSKARRFDKAKDKQVTFEDVAGIDEVERELVEIVDFLKNPEKYTRLGGTAPKGVLLIGAPGTGKTLLARAVAGEAGVPFFSMSAAEFVEMIVGVGAARVRDLFRQARENAPAIIFIDELDAIGRARGAIVIGGAASEQEQTLNQILTEMDGFSSKEGIIVLAATNQPDILDKALLRAGRFDRRIIINLPDKKGREEILKVHTKNVPMAGDVSLREVASGTPGLSGADLKNLVNEAALLAARKKQDVVHHQEFIDALEKILLGPERSVILSDEDRKRIAYHESGHAILGLIVPFADPVKRVTIVPRGQTLGVTYQLPVDDRYNYMEEYLRARLIGILGGRCAEELVFGSRSTGAENDIDQATTIARGMVTRWGMSDRVGMIRLSPKSNPYLAGQEDWTFGTKPFSEETARAVDEEVLRIIMECRDEARRLLQEHRTELDALASALLSRETLNEEEIIAATGFSSASRQEKTKINVANVPVHLPKDQTGFADAGKDFLSVQ